MKLLPQYVAVNYQLSNVKRQQIYAVSKENKHYLFFNYLPCQA